VSAGKCGRGRTSGRTFLSKNVRYDIPGSDEFEMKKYLPPYEQELTSFPPCPSESLCSVDGTCTMPHASAGTEMFQAKNFKKIKFGW
jgi:hypothetical protein